MCRKGGRGALTVPIVCLVAIETMRRAPAPPTRSRRPERAPRRLSRLGLILGGVLLLLAAAAAAVLEFSGASLSSDPDALARVTTGPLAGSLASVRAFGPGGRHIPISVRDGRLTPRAGVIAPGERVSVEVVVRRPGALSWLLGAERLERLVLTAPAAQLRTARVTVRSGAEPRISFDRPVSAVAYGRSARHDLPASPTTVFAPRGPAAGTLEVASAARSWERLGTPQTVTWFPPSRRPAAVVSPAPGTKIAPTTPLKLSFSRPIDRALGSADPKLTPATPGKWHRTDDYTLAFTPSGGGAALGTHLRVDLPRAVALVSPSGALRPTRSLAWTVPPGSTLRLQQLLAGAGYLPLRWKPSGAAVRRSTDAQVTAAVKPPAGSFSWRYPNTPSELRGLWHAGQANEITRGAVMAFQDNHGLTVDGLAGESVWKALIADAVSGKRSGRGYSYVYVHRDLPQTLILWHNGHDVIHSPGNTGVPAAPTALGTFPVFEHLAETTMTGTNPGGSHYSDPGIKWVSYFNGGDALHAFDRASFGTPQSVGCVELPLASAAKIWPYTPIGTLVTIEH